MIFSNDKASSEAEAYILGFFYADGFVTNKVNNKYYILATTVSAKDEQILVDMQNYFENSKIKKKLNKCQSGEFETVSLQICDVNLVGRVIGLGISPNKTYKNSSFILDNIPSELKHHFIRGYFDGDGTVGIYNSRCQFGVVSHNNALIEMISKQLIKVTGSSSSVKVENKKYSRFNLSGNVNCSKIKYYLYEDATIFLKRKKETFDSIGELYVKKYSYKGIKYNRQRNKWQSEIYVSVSDQKHYLGLFESEIDAVNAYNEYARKIGKKEQEII